MFKRAKRDGNRLNRPVTSKENASDFVIDDILPTVPVALFAFFLRKATPIDCLGGKTLETLDRTFPNARRRRTIPELDRLYRAKATAFSSGKSGFDVCLALEVFRS